MKPFFLFLSVLALIGGVSGLNFGYEYSLGFHWLMSTHSPNSKILNGILRAATYRSIFSLLSHEALQELESDENEAATFICQLAHGDVPDALAGLGEDVVDRVGDEVDDMVSFIEQLPDMVPNLIHDFEEGVVDVADTVSALVENPKSEVSVLFHDFTSDIASIWNGVTCDVEEWFGKSCSKTSSSAKSVWKTQCASVTSAAPTTSTGHSMTSASPSARPSSTYPSPTPTYTASHTSHSHSWSCSSFTTSIYSGNSQPTSTMSSLENNGQDDPATSSLASGSTPTSPPPGSSDGFTSGATKQATVYRSVSSWSTLAFASLLLALTIAELH